MLAPSPGQVAVGVVAEARRARGGILVEPVRRIIAAHAHITAERVEIVAAAKLDRNSNIISQQSSLH